MLQKKQNHLCLLLVPILTLAGCSVFGNSHDQTLSIAHYKAECVGIAYRLCMLSKKESEATFELDYDGIEGFTFEWGFSYTLLIEEHAVKNPPADGSSIRRTLLRVLSKEAVEVGSTFEIALTTGKNHRITEKGDGVFEFYGERTFICSANSLCDELSQLLQQASRYVFTFEHPASSDQPLILHNWRETGVW